MSIFNLTFVILHVTFCCFTAKGADVTLRCPEKWRNECPATLSCTLQTTNFNSAKCVGGRKDATEILFQGNGASSATSECMVDFSSSCDGTFNNEGCACYTSVGNGYIFKYKLVTTASKLANGSWFCEPNCFDGSLTFALTASRDATCSSVLINYFILEWPGIVLLSVGTALVIAGITMIIAAGLGIAGKVGIALGVVGYFLLFAGSALMTVAYIDDEPAGIAFLWVGSVLLIILGIGIFITDPCQKRDFSVWAKVGTCLMLVGGTLAIIGGIVAATERCPSDEFPTTLQEILGLVLAVIGFVVFVVGIIIEIVALKEEKNKT